MVTLRKYVACRCGANNSFDFSSDLSVEDLTLSARCLSCGASVNITVSAMLSAPSQPSAPQNEQVQQAVQEAHEPSMLDNLDQETKENVEQAVRDLFK